MKQEVRDSGRLGVRRIAGEKVKPYTEPREGGTCQRAMRANVWGFSGLIVGLVSALVWIWRCPRTCAPRQAVTDHSSPSEPVAQPADAEIEGYFIIAERDVRWSLIGVFSLGAVIAAIVWFVATNTPYESTSNAMGQRIAALRAAFAVEGVSSDVLVAVLGLVALVASLNIAIAAVGRGSDGKSTSDRVRTRVWLRGMGGVAYFLGVFTVGIAALQVAAWPPHQAVPSSLVALIAVATAFLAATTTLGSQSRVDEARTRALMRRELENIDSRLKLALRR